MLRIMARFPVFSQHLLLAFALTITTPLHSVLADGIAETKVKAEYIFNFTKFIDWPISETETLHICIIGNEQIVDFLRDLAKRESKGHLLQIWSETDQSKICNILFIDRNNPDLSRLLQETKGKSVLSVSDADNFTHQGGSIGFYNEDGQIKLEINLVEIRNAQLKINALLIEVARIFIPVK
jgi:hypothetical protein